MAGRLAGAALGGAKVATRGLVWERAAAGAAVARVAADEAAARAAGVVVYYFLFAGRPGWVVD